MKKSTILFLLIALLSACMVSSCQQRMKEEPPATDSCCVASVTADSLIGLWNTAWNTKNADALRAMIATDAVVIEQDWKVEGRDSIMAKWILVNLPAISNLKTEMISECNCCCCVSLTAYYTLDVTTEKGVRKEKGNFTFIWNQDEDKSWKLKVMHLDVF